MSSKILSINITNSECVLIAVINVPILFTLWLEKMLVKEKINWKRARMMHIANLLLILFIPILLSGLWGSKFGFGMNSNITMLLLYILFQFI